MTQAAPGKFHRKGLSLIELTRMFPDNETARKWIEKIRWPNGIHCPHCGSVSVQENGKHKTQDHRCRDCRKWFSVKAGTVMESSNLSYQVWVLAVYLLNTDLKGRASMKLHRDLNITQKSAWHLAHRIRETWEKRGGSLFGGPVEADETYVGGKRKNMSNAKRRQLAKEGAGRGTVGKAAVVGVKDRETGKVSAHHVQDTGMSEVVGFVTGHAKPGATVYTDDAPVYDILDAWYDHESVKHSVSEYVRGMAHTNGIESFWSMLKRGYDGTYHKMSPKHLQRYVNEFVGRHNVRESDTISQMAGTVAGMVGKQLRYADLIAEDGQGGVII